MSNKVPQRQYVTWSNMIEIVIRNINDAIMLLRR